MKKKDLEDCLDKVMRFTKTFEADHNETFSGLNKATEWLRERGYEIGSMERDFPIGLARNCDYIAKWSNINFWDRKRLDGAVVSSRFGFRDGDVVVYLNEDPDAKDQIKTSIGVQPRLGP